jgi:hypothetical protein
MPLDKSSIHDLSLSLSSSNDFNKCFKHILNDAQLSTSAKEFYCEKENYIGDAQKSQQPDCLINNTVYISQREVAILVNQRAPHDPIKAVGSDDATTCHILFLRTPHVTAVAHLDGASEVAEKFVQHSIASFRRFSAPSSSASSPLNVEVYLVGGFDDSHGYSRQILTEILTVLHNAPDVLFSVRLLAVGPLNSSPHRPAFLTKNLVDATSKEPLQYPVAYGAAIDLSTGKVRRTRFALEARAPEAALRLAAINCDSEMRVVYDELSGKQHPPLMTIEPFTCPIPADYIRSQIIAIAESSPARFLSVHSTSPHAEPDHFIGLTSCSWKLLLPGPEEASSKDDAERFTRKFFSGLDSKSPSAAPLARHYRLSPEGRWIRIQ